MKNKVKTDPKKEEQKRIQRAIKKTGFEHEYDLKDFKYLVKADASIEGSSATHYFRIRPIKLKEVDGKVIGVRQKERFSRSFTSFFTDTHHAELYSVERALRKCEGAGIENVLVRIDCKNIIHYLYGDLSRNAKKYLKEHESFARDLEIVKRLLDKVKGVIEFNPREFNTGADKGCSAFRNDLKMSINIGRVRNKPRKVNFNKKKGFNKYANRKVR